MTSERDSKEKWWYMQVIGFSHAETDSQLVMMGGLQMLCGGAKGKVLQSCSSSIAIRGVAYEWPCRDHVARLPGTSGAEEIRRREEFEVLIFEVER